MNESSFATIFEFDSPFCQPFVDDYVEPEASSAVLLLKSVPKETAGSEAKDSLGRSSETLASAKGDHVIEDLRN